jgi:rubrerythrin
LQAKIPSRCVLANSILDLSNETGIFCTEVESDLSIWSKEELSMNVYEYAMGMETDAEAIYKKMADNTDLKGIKKIFHDLASDERRHFETFKALKERTAASVSESPLLDEAKNVFTRMIEEKTGLAELKGDLEAYRHAMKLEAEAARFYREMLDKEQDASVRAQLKKIIDQEYNHFQIVENLYHFVNAPNQYLAWGEFSNIDEFHQFGREVDL